MCHGVVESHSDRPAVLGQSSRLGLLVCFSLVGGAGQGSSHIAEGLSTALQVFDDFKRVRHPGYIMFYT